MNVAESLELASNWLTESGIIHRDTEYSPYGPVKGGYLLDEEKYDHIYHETNGYAISCFVNLHRTTGDDKYIEHAKAIGDYLLSTLSGEDGEVSASAFVHSVSLPELRPVRKYFAFDNGMIVSGLLDLYEATREPKYYMAGKSCMSWVMDSLQQSDGAFHSHYDAETSEIWHGGASFEKDRSILHAKLAMPLLKVWKHSQDKRFLESAVALLGWAKGLQADDGAFWSDEYKNMVFTHSHCYSIEGFLYAYFTTENEKYRHVVNRGINWLHGAQLRDGSMNYQYKNTRSILDGLKDRLIKRKTSDATAQAVRLWLLADAIDNRDKYRTAAHRGIQFLSKMQFGGPDDHNLLGGLIYRQKKSIVGSHIQPVLYSWCTQFAVQAFTMWLQMESGSLMRKSVEYLF